MKAVATPDMARASIRLAAALDLPRVQMCAYHDRRMAIVGGGPSAADTLSEIKGYVATVNKAHDWLLEQGIRVHACGLVDPVPWLADYVTPRVGVTYFVASLCHPLVFEKLAGYRVVLWHAGQGEAVPMADIVEPGALLIPGGTSMVLRWLDLGHVLGFQKFDLHGFDCSNRAGKHHAYEFPQDDGHETVESLGFETDALLLKQADDFFRRLEFFEREKYPMEITVHGEGLLQTMFRRKYGDSWCSR
jgi:hypothetical protein